MRVNAVGEMASGIAHELTQPLAAILSQSQAGLRLAKTSPGLAAEIAGVLEANVRHAKRAGAILGRLRAYVTGEVPRARPTDLNVLVHGIAELVSRDLEQHDVVLALNLQEPEPWALVDPVSIEQVIHNLVQNAADAVQAAPRGQRSVAISTMVEKDEAVVRVTDQGPGIPAADLPRIFEPFYTTKPDGMGLGLSLCERLVGAAGGRIEAENQSGGGAVFTVRLPLAPA